MKKIEIITQIILPPLLVIFLVIAIWKWGGIGLLLAGVIGFIIHLLSGEKPSKKPWWYYLWRWGGKF